MSPTPDSELPGTLSINAWTGEAGVSAVPLADASKRWATLRAFPRYSLSLAAEAVNLRDWRHPKVGWGIVLPDNETLSDAERATPADAPEPIRELFAARPGAVVLRYRPELATMGFLRRYYAHRPAQDLALTGGAHGSDEQCLPRYLLICGGPRTIPWEFQYRLNLDFFVGRLDLEGVALENYVAALLSGWSGAGCRRAAPVLWSTEHGANDITRLMRLAIGDPLKARFAADSETQAGLCALFAADATAAKLCAALDKARPALVVSTSHGLTGPLSEPETMRARLGWLVAQDRSAIDPQTILDAWNPDGAVWYAHACCSAGGDERTAYRELVPADSQVARVLQGVADLGAATAGCPRALLGAEKPLRAFIGHVEPTFDWTLQAQTRQFLSEALLSALYDRLYLADPEPVGLAFQECYRLVGSLFAQWDRQVERIAAAADAGERASLRQAAMRSKLTALDRQSMVILGDPTVTLPRLLAG